MSVWQGECDSCATLGGCTMSFIAKSLISFSCWNRNVNRVIPECSVLYCEKNVNTRNTIMLCYWDECSIWCVFYSNFSVRLLKERQKILPEYIIRFTQLMVFTYLYLRILYIGYYSVSTILDIRFWRLHMWHTPCLDFYNSPLIWIPVILSSWSFGLTFKKFSHFPLWGWWPISS